MKVNGIKVKKRADFSWEDLSEAKLIGAKLVGAKLTGANLEDANLTGANLTGANLEDANLTGANLTAANLENANLTGANLEGANLHLANLTWTWFHGANLAQVNMTKAILFKTCLTEANLTAAVFTGSIFKPIFDNFVIADKTTVWPVAFSPEETWAKGAVIERSEVFKELFPDGLIDLRDSTIYGSFRTLRYALTRVSTTFDVRVELIESEVPMDLKKIQDDSRLHPVEKFIKEDSPIASDKSTFPAVSKETLLKMENYIEEVNPAKRLEIVELVAQYLMEDADDFANADSEEVLIGIKYLLSKSDGVVSLREHYVPALIWAFGELEQGRDEFRRFFPDGSIDLNDPEIDHYFQTLKDSLTEDGGEVFGLIKGYKVAPYANLVGADLVGVDLVGVDLVGANLVGANLEGANLEGANLREAILGKTNFVGANLSRSELLLIKSNNDFDWSSGSSTPAAAVEIGSNLTGANLEEANLEGANFAGASFTGANLVGANLGDANLYGANLNTANLRGANLRGTNLNRAEVHGTNFTHTNLADAVFDFLAFDGETVWSEDFSL